MRSPFLARDKNYNHFELGTKVEVVVYAMSGEEICKIYVTIDDWYLTCKIQKSAELDRPMRDLIEADLMDEPLFIALQELVGDCLRVPSCSIGVVDVSCNGIGVASGGMAMPSLRSSLDTFTN